MVILISSWTSFSGPRVHGPDDGPVRGGAYAIKDSLHGDPTGTIGQLYVITDEAVTVDAFHALGVTPERVELSNLRFGRGTSEFVYKNEMTIDRVRERPFGDGTLPAQRSPLDNAILFDYVIAGEAPVEIFGYRLDYRIDGNTYAAYWPIFQCLAVGDDRLDECSDLPILTVDELRELPVTLIPPG